MQIAETILKAAGGQTGGLTKTKIMFCSFLSCAQLKHYFVMLLENDLLNYDDNNQKYTVTEKGFQFIKDYERLSELIPEMIY